MQAIKELIGRLTKYYWLEAILAVFFFIIALLFVYDSFALLSAIARKVALATSGLILYYIVRYLKIGTIEWEHPYDKIYSLVILVYIGLIFAFG